MTASEYFDERWENERRCNPEQPVENRDREWMIYYCGWEDGIRTYINELQKNKEPKREDA